VSICVNLWVKGLCRFIRAIRVIRGYEIRFRFCFYSCDFKCPRRLAGSCPFVIICVIRDSGFRFVVSGFGRFANRSYIELSVSICVHLRLTKVFGSLSFSRRTLWPLWPNRLLFLIFICVHLCESVVKGSLSVYSCNSCNSWSNDFFWFLVCSFGRTAMRPYKIRDNPCKSVVVFIDFWLRICCAAFSVVRRTILKSLRPLCAYDLVRHFVLDL